MLLQTQTEMCQKIRNRKMNPTHPPMLMLQLDCCLCGAEYYGMSILSGSLLSTTLWSLSANNRCLFFGDCLEEGMSAVCLRPTQHSNQTSNYCQNGLSLLTPPPLARTPSPRCEKDKHILQNISHQRRRYFRIYLGVFNAAKRSRENHLWRKCWD